jgi:pimeloyl-ACP methyl ester carboxylesterase
VTARTIIRKTSVVIGLFLGVYVAVVVGAILMQRKLLYFPTRDSLDRLVQAGRNVRLESWTLKDRAVGWRRPAPHSPALGTVLVVHGNAGHAILRAVYADAFQRAANVDVCVLEYPGYGFRDGEASESAFCTAADEVVLAMEPGTRLFVVGESLGTGVACYLAGAYSNRIDGLLLVAPYDRLTNVAQDHFPWLPARWILRDRFDSVTHLSHYQGRVAIWVGGNDVVVPARFGRRLYESFSGPKMLRDTAGAGHEDVFHEPPEWWKQVTDFWMETGAGKSR